VNVKAVLNIDDSQLVGYTRLVALEIAIHCDRRRIIRMGQKELAELIGVSRVTVGKIFNSLENRGVIERMGHGRYRMTKMDDAVESEDSLPQPKGVQAEIERLKTIRKSDQVLCFTKDGWPILQDEKDLPSTLPDDD